MEYPKILIKIDEDFLLNGKISIPPVLATWGRYYVYEDIFFDVADDFKFNLDYIIEDDDNRRSSDGEFYREPEFFYAIIPEEYRAKITNIYKSAILQELDLHIVAEVYSNHSSLCIVAVENQVIQSRLVRDKGGF